jgi:pyruvate dehydrogenase E1 component
LREVEAAAELLEQDFGVATNVWSLTSVNELAREGNDVVRWNRLHPMDTPRVPYLTQQLADASGPFIAATDYQKAHTEQLREFIPGEFTVLGTDGFGRSDTRQQLRQHFEVSREHIALAALKALADRGEVDIKTVAQAISQWGIDADKPNPMRV